MANIGDLRWHEVITIGDDHVVKREKTLQSYRKNAWGYKDWYNIDVNREVVELNKPDPVSMWYNRYNPFYCSTCTVR